jgi:hypothetical protein
MALKRINSYRTTKTLAYHNERGHLALVSSLVNNCVSDWFLVTTKALDICSFRLTLSMHVITTA